MCEDETIPTHSAEPIQSSTWTRSAWGTSRAFLETIRCCMCAFVFFSRALEPNTSASLMSSVFVRFRTRSSDRRCSPHSPSTHQGLCSDAENRQVSGFGSVTHPSYAGTRTSSYRLCLCSRDDHKLHPFPIVEVSISCAAAHDLFD